MAKHSITDIPSMIRFRNTSQKHRETIDVYGDDIWKTLMTQENFNMAARLGFIEFITKWLELKEMIEKPLSGLQAVFNAIKHDQHDFYIELMKHVTLPADIEVVIGVLLSKHEFIDGLLSSGSSINVMIRPNDIDIFELAHLWSGTEMDDYGELSDLAEADEDFGLFYFVVEEPLLTMTVNARDLPMIKLLIEHGADPKLDYNSGDWGLFGQAFVTEDLEIIHYLYPLIDLDIERPGVYRGELKDLHMRLVPSIRWAPEIDQFNQAESLMFIKAAVTQQPGEFIEHIVAFGNVAYMPLAMLVLEQHKDQAILTRMLPRDGNHRTSLNTCYSFYLGDYTYGSPDRLKFAPLFLQMENMGYEIKQDGEHILLTTES